MLPGVINEFRDYDEMHSKYVFVQTLSACLQQPPNFSRLNSLRTGSVVFVFSTALMLSFTVLGILQTILKSFIKIKKIIF